jgi:hypothetical protein
MEKQQLIIELNKVLHQSQMSVDLYFVFKNGDIFIQYLADPNDALRTEIITDFSKTLEIFTAPNNQYELNDVYDDNEYEDYHLFFDDINNNQIAQAIFNFDRANALDYTPAAGSLSKIFGFLIEISNGTDNVTIYKRNQPTNAINPRTAINFFTGTDNKLQLINQNATYITKTIDLFKIGNTILINSRSVYEHQFGFIAELQTRAETGYVDLSATGAFQFAEELQGKVQHLPKGELKKLKSIMKSNPIIETKNWKSIIRQAKKYAKHDFELSEDGFIKIQTQKEFKILISILNRDFNFNDASKERFITKNKKLIR